MKPLKSNIKQDANVIIESLIEKTFSTLHKKYKTASGDISPLQQHELEELQNKISSLICEQVFQNIK